MIDTDKYEGHLIDKAVEDNSQVWVWSEWMLGNSMTIEQHNATAELLRDAPLLLAEVKRLREATQQIIGNIELWCNGNTVPKDILMEKLKEMIE
jgi:hypothetical protein